MDNYNKIEITYGSEDLKEIYKEILKKAFSKLFKQK